MLYAASRCLLGFGVLVLVGVLIWLVSRLRLPIFDDRDCPEERFVTTLLAFMWGPALLFLLGMLTYGIGSLILR